jgi:diguanylate cyclase (GGDEF)-like protein
MDDHHISEAGGGERAALQDALALPGYRLLTMSPALEDAFAHSRQALAISEIRDYWRTVVLAVALIALALFTTDLVDPRLESLVLLACTVIAAIIGMVALGATLPALHPHIDAVVSVAAAVGLLGMHVGVLVATPGSNLQAVTEYGCIFVMIALFTLSGLGFRQALLVGVLTLFAVVGLAWLSDGFPVWRQSLGAPAMFDPLFVAMELNWQRFAFYGPGALLIGTLLGVSNDMRERRVFLQERLLVHEKHELDQLSRELTLISREDALTHLANRRHFDEVFAREWSACLREGVSMNLFFIDVDYFKRYNDHYGHQAGDDCLARVAGALALQAKRGADFVARYGGEEFVAFFPRTNSAGLAAIAERMVVAVDELGIPHSASDAAAHVTISVGIASVTPMPGMSSETLLQAADTALYRAKQAGRHRYVASWVP